MRRGDYGYDAPYGLVLFGVLAAVGAMFTALSWLEGRARGVIPRSFFALYFLANALTFLHTTRRGKFLEWDRILDELALRGDERVLDMGWGNPMAATTLVTASKKPAA